MNLKKINKILTFPLGIILIFSYREILSFLKIKSSYSKKHNELLSYMKKMELSFLKTGTYEWDKWRMDLGKKFSNNVPINFLHNKLISGTMVLGSTEHQNHKISFIEDNMNLQNIKKILRENVIGFPVISNFRYLASENSIHQAFHLASYKNITGKDPFDSKHIIEWGGGYGCLARMFKRVLPDCTYIIIDLPELSALQYVYLSSIYGSNQVNFITNEYKIEPGKINLISSDYYMSINDHIETDTFISNWALTESGKDYQDFVLKSNFFKAKNILIGCIDDENNYLTNNLDHSFKKKETIKVLGDGNLYLMS
tara:strand:- start:1396 stop:2331 length:936 start_codon:yes stop_codon:yes gene_type:complete